MDKVNFMVKRNKGLHTCAKVFNNKATKWTWVAKHYDDQIRSHFCINADVLSKLLKQDHNIDVNLQVSQRERKIALCELKKQHVKDLNKL